MNAAPTNWMPGLVMLSVGGVAALVYLIANKRGSASEATGSVDDTKARYDGLIAELKELNANKHLHTADAFSTEKTRLEKAAAEVLKLNKDAQHEVLKAEGRAQAKAKAAAADTGFFAKSPALKGALIGGAVVGFVFFLSNKLQEQAKPRDDAPAPMQQARPDDKLEKLIAAAAASPQDTDAQAAAGLALMRKQRFEEGVPYIQTATLLDPFHVRTRVGRAVMRALEGDGAGSLADLEGLASRYPEAFEGRLFAGMLAMDSQDSQRALTNFEAYLAAAGEEAPPMMRMAIQQLRTQLGQ
jgi:hypothetical protein